MCVYTWIYMYIFQYWKGVEEVPVVVSLLEHFEKELFKKHPNFFLSEHSNHGNLSYEGERF